MKFVIVLLLTCCVFKDSLERQVSTLEDDAVEKRNNSRIVGGYFIPKDKPQYPWAECMLKFFPDRNDPTTILYVCTGTILSSRTVISFSDCLAIPNLITDKLQVEITGKNGIRIIKEISSIARNLVTYSLALGYVDTPFDMNQVNVMNLPPKNWAKDHYLGQSLTICAYQDPYLAPSAPTFTNFISEHTCNIFLPRADTYCTSQELQMTSTTICATPTAANIMKVAACFSDVGSAIYYYDATNKQFIIWGVLTQIPFPCPQKPAIFTVLVGAENDWVLSNIQG